MVAKATSHGKTNSANNAQSAQMFSHFQRVMRRVGVAKLPLSTPAPNASVAAPVEAINNMANGMIIADRDNSFVYICPCWYVNLADGNLPGCREKNTTC